MGKEIIMSGDVKIEIHKFHCYKNSNFLNDINVDNIFISKEIYSGKKNMLLVIQINIKPFSMIVPETSACVKSYDGSATKWMHFLIEDEELLKNMICRIKSAILYKRRI